MSPSLAEWNYHQMPRIRHAQIYALTADREGADCVRRTSVVASDHASLGKVPASAHPVGIRHRRAPDGCGNIGCSARAHSNVLRQRSMLAVPLSSRQGRFQSATTVRHVQWPAP